MSRVPKWNSLNRKMLLKMIKEGKTEREIRKVMAGRDKRMTSVEFAHQLKMALVEDGTIKKRTPKIQGETAPDSYKITPKGRLVITDFSEKVGAEQGASFILEKPRGRSKAWRLVPA